MGVPEGNRSSEHFPGLARSYRCPTADDPARRRLIVRDGELLVGPPAERSSAAELEALRTETVRTGEGIEVDDGALQWRARVPGFGYLLEDEHGKLEVRPAIRIAEDRLQATVELHRPTGDEAPLRREELDGAIEASGIVHGLAPARVEAVWRMFETSGALPGPVPIAAGTAPVQAGGAGIDFSVELGRSTGGQSESLDQIDFREKHLVVNVYRHQELGRWHAPSEGRPGLGVDGTELECASPAESVPLRVGSGISTRNQEDGSVLLLAELDGMLVVTEDGTPFVMTVLEIPGDVGLGTGDIEANGSVVIAGAVHPGSRISASGDITVRGTVEGASLRSGGGITIEAGLIGEEGTKVVAMGDVVIKYSQNAFIVSGGDVRILGSETASRIECRGDLTATEGKGRLQGGKYLAGGSVSAREFGSELGVPTFVRAGRDPLREYELKKVRDALRELTAEERKQRRSMDGGEKGDTMRLPRTKAKAAMVFTRRRKLLNDRLARIQERPEGGDDPQVVAQVRAYYGLDIVIGQRTRRLEESISRCRFVLGPETGEIEVQTL